MTDINLQNVLKIKILITSVDKKVVKSDLYFFFTIAINSNFFFFKSKSFGPLLKKLFCFKKCLISYASNCIALT